MQSNFTKDCFFARDLPLITSLNPQNNHYILPIVQMRELRLKELKLLAQDHTTTRKGQEPVALTTPLYIFINLYICRQSFPNGSVGEESTCTTGDTGDVGLIPGLGRSPGEGHGNPLQYSCLENSMYKGCWRARVQMAAKSWT